MKMLKKLKRSQTGFGITFKCLTFRGPNWDVWRESKMILSFHILLYFTLVRRFSLQSMDIYL